MMQSAGMAPGILHGAVMAVSQSKVLLLPLRRNMIFDSQSRLGVSVSLSALVHLTCPKQVMEQVWYTILSVVVSRP